MYNGMRPCMEAYVSTIISVTGIKGGTSKTTTAVHLGAYLKRQGKTVTIVDADEQGSSFNWCHFLDIPTLAIDDPDDLFDRLDQINSEYIIIDPPAGGTEITRVILSCADLAIIPCKASSLDIHSLKRRTIRLVLQAQKLRAGAPKAFLFICQVKPQSVNMLYKAQYILQDIGVPLTEAVIHDRDAIANSAGEGTTVWEMASSGAAKAKQDYQKLFTEIGIL